VPAAAVIPALKMHRIIAAVKKLVVGSVPSVRSARWARTGRGSAFLLASPRRWPSLVWRRRASTFTLNKSECLTQAFRLHVRAWNNRRGFRSDFIGFADRDNG
jgi:hypothetical protein